MYLHLHKLKKHNIHTPADIRVTVPASLPYSQKHEDITVKDDPQWNKENKTAQHHRVAPIGHCVCNIIPCARCHQALRDIGA